MLTKKAKKAILALSATAILVIGSFVWFGLKPSRDDMARLVGGVVTVTEELLRDDPCDPCSN